MKRLTLTLAAGVLATLPLYAQETESEDGFSLMEEGAKLFFRGIMEEMEPAMDDLRGLADEMQPALRDFVEEMGPALAELLGKIDDLSVYHPPEMQPNGDIILRRKTPIEQEEEPQGEVEL